MSREIRSLAARHPFEVRYRARELYLRGISLADIPELIGRELDEKNAMQAKEAGLPAPPPTERLAPRVVRYWFDEGKWSHYRKSTERVVLKEQVNRIKREFSERMRIQAARLRLNQSVVERYFYKQELGEKGEALFRPDGTPKVVIKTPEDAPMDMADTVRLHLAGIKLDIEQLKVAGDMLGGFVPKVSPEDFTLGAAPPPLARTRAITPAPVEVPESPVEVPASTPEPEPSPKPKRTRKPRAVVVEPEPVVAPEPPAKKKRKRRKIHA